MAAKESKSESISDVTPQAKTEKESVRSLVKSESGNMVSHDDDDGDVSSFQLIADEYNVHQNNHKSSTDHIYPLWWAMKCKNKNAQ